MLVIPSPFAGLVIPRARKKFAPTDISGCELWVRADLGVTLTSGAVSAWADQSGNGRDFSQGTAGNRPTVSTAAINGHDAILFDGSNDRMLSTDFAVGAPRHIFTVYRIVDALGSSNRRVWHSDNDSNSNSPLSLTHTSNNANARLTGNGNDGTSGVLTLDETNFWLVSVVYNGTSSSIARNDDAPLNVTNNIGTSNTDGFTLGGRFNQDFANVAIAEMIVYDGTISGTDLTNLKNYINGRYGLW